MRKLITVTAAAGMAAGMDRAMEHLVAMVTIQDTGQDMVDTGQDTVDTGQDTADMGAAMRPHTKHQSYRFIQEAFTNPIRSADRHSVAI